MQIQRFSGSLQIDRDSIQSHYGEQAGAALVQQLETALAPHRQQITDSYANVSITGNSFHRHYPDASSTTGISAYQHPYLNAAFNIKEPDLSFYFEKYTTFHKPKFVYGYGLLSNAWPQVNRLLNRIFKPETLESFVQRVVKRAENIDQATTNHYAKVKKRMEQTA